VTSADAFSSTPQPTTLKTDIYQLLHKGKQAEALLEAQSAIESKQHQLDVNDPASIRAHAAALETRGDVYREMDDLTSASQDYQLAIEELQEDPDAYALIGSLHSSLGAISHVTGNSTEAAQYWQLAIRYFENCTPPLLVDVATTANNLAFLYKYAGDFDSAENCFLRALEALYQELGQNDEQTATVSCNLGTLYQQAGFYDQSIKMHTLALTARLKILGKSHPDTAQSNNNLGLAYAEVGDTKSAISHFEDALKCFKSLGPEYQEDFNSACTNYSTFLQNIGETDKAEKIASGIR